MLFFIWVLRYCRYKTSIHTICEVINVIPVVLVTNFDMFAELMSNIFVSMFSFLRKMFSLECFTDLFHRRELSIVINWSSAVAFSKNLPYRVLIKAYIYLNNDLLEHYLTNLLTPTLSSTNYMCLDSLFLVGV